jgi:hypothetical protein
MMDSDTSRDERRTFIDPWGHVWEVQIHLHDTGDHSARAIIDEREAEVSLTLGESINDALIWNAFYQGDLSLEERLARLIDAPPAPHPDPASWWLESLRSAFMPAMERDWHAQSPLHRAVAGRHEERVRVLLSWGARPAPAGSEFGPHSSPLKRALNDGHQQLVDLLLQSGNFPGSDAERALAALAQSNAPWALASANLLRQRFRDPIRLVGSNGQERQEEPGPSRPKRSGPKM